MILSLKNRLCIETVEEHRGLMESFQKLAVGKAEEKRGLSGLIWGNMYCPIIPMPRKYEYIVAFVNYHHLTPPQRQREHVVLSSAMQVPIAPQSMNLALKGRETRPPIFHSQRV